MSLASETRNSQRRFARQKENAAAAARRANLAPVTHPHSYGVHTSGPSTKHSDVPHAGSSSESQAAQKKNIDSQMAGFERVRAENAKKRQAHLDTEVGHGALQGGAVHKGNPYHSKRSGKFTSKGGP